MKVKGITKRLMTGSSQREWGEEKEMESVERCVGSTSQQLNFRGGRCSQLGIAESRDSGDANHICFSLARLYSLLYTALRLIIIRDIIGILHSETNSAVVHVHPSVHQFRIPALPMWTLSVVGNSQAYLDWGASDSQLSPS